MTRISFPLPRQALISANDRPGHWAIRHRKTADLRRLAAVMWDASGLPSMERATVTVTVRWSNRSRRRDAHNLAPTIKALIDGCVSAGALPDDDDQHLTAVTFVSGPADAPAGHVVIELTWSAA